MQVIASEIAVTKTINVGVIGKSATVRLYGCTFTDLTTTKNINGVTTLSVVIPAPTSIYESVLAEVFVDGQRFEAFQVTSSGVKQFDSRYFIKPYLKEDADLSTGPLLMKPSSGTYQTIAADLALLPKHTGMPAVVTFIYYDWATDLMYFFGSDVTKLEAITTSTKVWTVSFAADPVVDYSSYSGNSDGGSSYPHYHFIFTTSGRVIELFARNTVFEYKDRQLPHPLKSACCCCIDATDSLAYTAKAVLLTVDQNDVIRKYKLSVTGTPTLLGQPVAAGVPVARIVGNPTYDTSTPYAAALISTESRSNLYKVNVNTNLAVAPTLTKQLVSADLQVIDSYLELKYARCLAYNFSTNVLVYVYWSGAAIRGVNYVGAGGGRLVRSRIALVTGDAVIYELSYGSRYSSSVPYVADQGWLFDGGFGYSQIGRVRKQAKSYIIDGASIGTAPQPTGIRFNGRYLSFKLTDTTPSGFKIVLPPSLTGTIRVNGAVSDQTVPGATVQVTFDTDVDQTSYSVSIGRTLVGVSVDGLYTVYVGTEGKTSTVTLYGGAFLDGTTTKTVTGVAPVKFNIPVPSTEYESNIAEVYVDGLRVAYFTRQPYASDMSLKKFNPTYFTRPYLNSDIDASQGLLRAVQSQAASGLPTYLRVDTLAKLAEIQATVKSCYYDYYTDKMYWFDVVSPADLTVASQVYVEDFSADPLACYQQIDGSSIVGTYLGLRYFVLFHKSGKVRFQHSTSKTYPSLTLVKQLDHDIVAGCAVRMGFSASDYVLDGTATIVVSDSEGNLYKYRLSDAPDKLTRDDTLPMVLKGKVVGTRVVKLASLAFAHTAPTILALSDEARTNAYTVDASVENPPTLTRQIVSASTKDLQAIDINPYYQLLLVYDFAANRTRLVNLTGADANETFARNFALLSGTGGKLASGIWPLVVADAFMRLYDRNLPHVSTTLAYANPVTFLDSNNDYGNTTINQGVYNNKADGTVEAVVANAIGPTVVEHLVYDWTGTNTEGKKVKYIDVYNWDGTNYVLHQTLNTKPVVVGTYTETLVLATPMLLHSSRKIKLVARELWGGYNDVSYRWVTEINVMINSA